MNRSGGKRAELTQALNEINFRKGGIDRATISSPYTLNDVMLVMNFGAVVSYIGIEYGEGATISFDANTFHFKKLQL